MPRAVGVSLKVGVRVLDGAWPGNSAVLAVAVTPAGRYQALSHALCIAEAGDNDVTVAKSCRFIEAPGAISKGPRAKTLSMAVRFH